MEIKQQKTRFRKENHEYKAGSKKKKALIGLFGIILVAAGYLVYEFFIKEDPFTELTGNIYLTLAPEGGQDGNLYYFDIENKEILPLFDETFGETFISFTSSLTHNEDKVAYMSAQRSTSTDAELPWQGYFALLSYDTETDIFERLNDEQLSAVRLPEWSPNESKIAFTAFTEDGEFRNPNDWGVYVYDFDTDTSTQVATGTHPHWSSNNEEIIYIKNEGFHIVNIETGTTRRVAEYPDEVLASVAMQLDVSTNGSKLAITDDISDTLYIYSVTSWDPFEMEVQDRVAKKDKVFYWPVFSPDGKYLAVEMLDWNTELSGVENPRLAVFDLATMEYKTIANLSAYNFNFIFITDWK